jgi:hypothetical protein
MGLKTLVFRSLRENLIYARPEYIGREVILCPFCLREITLEQLSSIEHIVAQNVLKDDPPYMKQHPGRSRAGVTALCRHPRTTKTGHAPNGCNGWKGQKYDRLFRRMLQAQRIDEGMLRLQHYVAVLIMAYLGAFQRLGYEYIMRVELDDIRHQFDYPDRQVTHWLDHVHIRLSGHPGGQIWATTSGLPFVFGSLASSKAPLEVSFRRFSALLPGGHWAVKKQPEKINLETLWAAVKT